MKGMLQLLGMFVSLVVAAGAATAQTYPSKPVRVVLAVPAGTNQDIGMRAVAPEMSKLLGQPIILENRPGADSAIAANAVKEAAPDGYTIFCCSFPNRHPIFVKTDAIVGGKDLSTIGDFGASPIFFLVRSSLGPKTFGELVAYSKANPRGLNNGSTSDLYDLLFEVIKARTGINVINVRFKGSPYNEMLSGEIDIVLGNLPVQQVQSGKIIALFGSSRLPGITGQVPLTTEVGLPPIVSDARHGLWGPAALSSDIRRKLSSAIAAAVKTPAISEFWQKMYFIQVPNTPEDQQRAYDERIAGFAEGARLAKYQPQ